MKRIITLAIAITTMSSTFAKTLLRERELLFKNEEVAVAKIKCQKLIISRNVQLRHPEEREGTPPKQILIHCDEVVFNKGSLLKTYSHLQIRAHFIRGDVNILGAKYEEKTENTARESGKSGADGGNGGDGWHGGDGSGGGFTGGHRSKVGGVGNGGVRGGNGENGEDGADGKNGAKQVNIDLLADRFDPATTIHIVSTGQSGKRGTDGGSGGAGGLGGTGGNGGKGGKADVLFHSAAAGGAGGNGGNGGDGGDGGNGGNGGNGGDGGDIFIVVNTTRKAIGDVEASEIDTSENIKNSDITPKKTTVDNFGGDPGMPGVGGTGGAGGSGGSGGTGGNGGKGKVFHKSAKNGPPGKAGAPGKRGKDGLKGTEGKKGKRGKFAENVTGFSKLKEFKIYKKEIPFDFQVSADPFELEEVDFRKLSFASTNQTGMKLWANINSDLGIDEKKSLTLKYVNTKNIKIIKKKF